MASAAAGTGARCRSPSPVLDFAIYRRLSLQANLDPVVRAASFGIVSFAKSPTPEKPSPCFPGLSPASFTLQRISVSSPSLLAPWPKVTPAPDLRALAVRPKEMRSAAGRSRSRTWRSGRPRWRSEPTASVTKPPHAKERERERESKTDVRSDVRVKG